MEGETIMAFNMIETNGQVQYNVSTFVVDSPDDLKKLPKNCAQGSAVLCTSDGSVYIKDSKGDWKEV